VPTFINRTIRHVQAGEVSTNHGLDPPQKITPAGYMLRIFICQRSLYARDPNRKENASGEFKLRFLKYF